MTDEPPTVGDLFNPADVIDQWVFALTAATEDLAIAEAAFKAQLDADSNAQLVGYHPGS